MVSPKGIVLESGEDLAVSPALPIPKVAAIELVDEFKEPRGLRRGGILGGKPIDELNRDIRVSLLPAKTVDQFTNDAALHDIVVIEDATPSCSAGFFIKMYDLEFASPIGQAIVHGLAHLANRLVNIPKLVRVLRNPMDQTA